ncbi:DUF4089 domain-containing protein [Myxosarcina sp. GI1]|uniref:DUF4089 domain-containing protein n=1 Tax=Myxosarcina sp. GI1 TaxID=1541065 RepID=UPI000560A3B2|nr:DUF4089 domain-containing protein [Myxosarcina sp. GI1]
MTEAKPNYTEYVKQTAELMGLKLTPEYLSGVVDNFTRLSEVAALVMEFDLPEDIEPAPTFEP